MTPTQLVDAAPSAPEPVGRRTGRLLFDTLTVSVFSILAKLAGAAKAIVIASVFGSGLALDHYLLAFMLPSLLADTFCGALVPVTVPRLVELEHRAPRASALAFYARVLNRSFSFSMLGSAAIGTGIAVALLFCGDAWRTVGLLTLPMLPVIPLNAVANVWRAGLNSQHRFAIPALTVVLTPAVIMLCVVLAGRSGGVWVLAAGTTLGAAAELILLGAAIRRSGFPWTAQRIAQNPPDGPSMNRFRKEYGYMAGAAAIGGGSVFLGQAMAASLGAGSVSELNYGTRLAGVILSVGPAALSVTVLPRFSRLVAERDWPALKRSLRRLLLASAGVSAVVAIALMSFSAPIVRLTLQRGAFTAADTGAVAAVQAWSLLQMPFVVGIAILMRVFSALQANRVLLPLSGATLALNLALNYALMNRYGVAGISLASSIAQSFLFLAMAGLAFGPIGGRFMKELD